MERIRTLLAAVLVGLAVLAGRAYADEEFVRGDTNGDGVVDTIDAENIATYLFAVGTYWRDVPCSDSFDVDDDGVLDISDVVYVWRHWSGYDTGSSTPWRIPAPYPAAGPDPTPDALTCTTWPSCPPIAEATMLVGVDGGTVAGGAVGHLQTAIWIRSEVAVNAVQGKLRLEGCPNAEFRLGAATRAAALSSAQYLLGYDGCSVAVGAGFNGFASDPYDFAGRIPAGERTVLVNLVVCLPEGTPAGAYRLYFDNPAVGLAGDFNAHTCAAQEGIIEVASAVGVAECPDPVQPVRPDCWPPLPFCCGSEGDVEISVTAPSALTAQDNRFTATVSVKSPVPLGSLDVALDFNEYMFRVADVAETFAPEGVLPRTFDTVLGPEGCATTVNDAAEGYVVFHVELDPLPAAVTWNAETPYEVARITFDIWNPIANAYGDTVLRLGDVGERGQFFNRADDGTAELYGMVVWNHMITLPGAEPPQVATPAEAEVTFRMGDASGKPGATGVPVYAYIDTNTAVCDIRMSFTYDDSILQYEGTTLLAHVSGEADSWALEWCSGTPQGARGAFFGCWFLPDRHLDFARELLYYPAADEPVACIRFRIREDAKPGATAEVTFLENGELNRCSVEVAGRNVSPDAEPAEVRVTRLYSGKVLVDLETTIFLRGDSNGDDLVNIADAIWTLAFLFRHGTPPACLDAADTNDDGLLDIADPIVLLTTLFTSNKCIAPPYPLRGTDLTPAAWAPCVD